MKFDNVIEMLKEMLEEGVPKNIQSDIENIISCLESDADEVTKVHKALSVLDEIANDVNLASHTRTEFWNLSSVLEGMLS